MMKQTRRSGLMLVAALGLLVISAGCGGDGGPGGTPIPSGSHVLVAWNDLGMHCLNPTYDEAVILPPYNTVWAQVIERGDPPRIVTDGVTVEYRFAGNTSSSGKTDAFGADFAGFWAHDEDLFGVDLPVDHGLNLAEPAVHNGLAGTMALAGDHFVVHGAPLVPVDDGGTWNPYQVAEITAKNAQGEVLATATAVAPTSDEIRCSGCHAQNGPATGDIGGGGPSVWRNVLALHDLEHGAEYAPDLVDRMPVLCASCHASPALGTAPPAEREMYLSAAIHGAHAALGETEPGCYDCHPGEVTRCNRSLAHQGTAADGGCVTCHGPLSAVASSIVGGRTPWVDEPACSEGGCHQGVQGMAANGTLYRDATGHGGVRCAGCHGSPHAMVPSRVAADNLQAIDHQGSPHALGSCAACHDSNRGEGSEEFAEKHGGGTPEERTACHVCHTAIEGGGTAQWPHAFTWHAR